MDTQVGHVNGARGIVSRIQVVLDPTGMSFHLSSNIYIIADLTTLAKFFELDDLYVLCTKRPTCVLFQQDNPKHNTAFEGLEAHITPVFPITRSIKIKGYSVRRKQVPMCAAFCMTDYKIQGSTLKNAVLDLKDDPTTKGQDGHKKFCSRYVQLSRLETETGLNLLQELDMNDLQFHPHDLLLAEMERLRELERKTIAAWTNQT
jgi:hypothetical protein